MSLLHNSLFDVTFDLQLVVSLLHNDFLIGYLDYIINDYYVLVDCNAFYLEILSKHPQFESFDQPKNKTIISYL